FSIYKTGVKLNNRSLSLPRIKQNNEQLTTNSYL
ncbi:MAG: hypothetical protein ACI902_002940, partial [Psychroserpens sp.]